MIVGIISDVHGSPYWLNKALNYLKDVEVIVSLGDLMYHGPRNPFPRDYSPSFVATMVKNDSRLIFIKGNCDSDVDEMVVGKPFERRAFFYFEGLKILAIHGDEVSDYKELAKIHNFYDVIMFGHIHIPVLEKVDSTLLFNPGSISLPKNNNPNSFGILNTSNRTFEIFDFSQKLISKISME